MNSYVESLFKDADLVELVSIRNGLVQAGLFDDRIAFAKEVQRIGVRGNVYTTLNAPRLSGAANRVNSAHRLRDSDMAWRARLLFDFDPVRPKGEPATEDEVASARDAASTLESFLRSMGWPRPLSVNRRPKLTPHRRAKLTPLLSD